MLARERRSGAAGFTLLEILVVVAIIGMFSTVVVINVIDHLRNARVEKARADLIAWEGAVQTFFLDNGFYPSTEQGLAALVTPPTSGRVPRRFPKGGYVTRPKFDDPWGHPYLYLHPGAHGEFDILTQGADGEPGGTEYDRDLGTWNLHLPED